jgi:hypothetical protein
MSVTRHSHQPKMRQLLHVLRRTKLPLLAMLIASRLAASHQSTHRVQVAPAAEGPAPQRRTPEAWAPAWMSAMATPE